MGPEPKSRMQGCRSARAASLWEASMGPEPKSRMQVTEHERSWWPGDSELQWGLNRSPGCRRDCNLAAHRARFGGASMGPEPKSRMQAASLLPSPSRAPRFNGA